MLFDTKETAQLSQDSIVLLFDIHSDYITKSVVRHLLVSDYGKIGKVVEFPTTVSSLPNPKYLGYCLLL